MTPLTFVCMECDQSIAIILPTIESWRVSHTNRVVTCICGAKYLANLQISLLRDEAGLKPWQRELPG